MSRGRESSRWKISPVARGFNIFLPENDEVEKYRAHGKVCLVAVLLKEKRYIHMYIWRWIHEDILR